MCFGYPRQHPRWSILALGVVDTDDDIRVGDEVVVEGPQAFGVGRAEMFGREMAESTWGETAAMHRGLCAPPFINSMNS